MDRERPAQRERSKSDFAPVASAHLGWVCESHQQPLFSAEIFERAGRPIHLTIPDPQQPDRVRTLVVASGEMRRLIDLLGRAAPTCGTILLHGESGSGKNLLACLVHQLSRRHQGPFIQFSAGQLPESLVESELFGHEAGSFTGAREAKPGKFESAHGGTLFIDEVGDLAPAVQLKLHRFLDDQVVERVGASSLRVADVRIIAATHRDLWGLVKEGRFREDLYYRLSVVCLRVPSLRERPEEIPAIAELLLRELSLRHGKAGLRWEPGVLEFFSQLPWSGNVRELRNVVERMVILARHDRLGLEDLPESLTSVAPASPEAASRARFVQTYQRCLGNRSAIAKACGTSRSQVRRLIDRYRPEIPLDQQDGPGVDHGPQTVQT